MAVCISSYEWTVIYLTHPLLIHIHHILKFVSRFCSHNYAVNTCALSWDNSRLLVEVECFYAFKILICTPKLPSRKLCQFRLISTVYESVNLCILSLTLILSIFHLCDLSVFFFHQEIVTRMFKWTVEESMRCVDKRD